MKGKREHTRLAYDKLWDDTQWLEGQGASMGPQPKKTFSSSRSKSRGLPEKLPSGTGGQNRAGRSLRMLSMKPKSSQSSAVRSQARKARDWHG